MDWMLMPFRRYAEFSGRSRRKEYWMFTLLNVIVIVVLAILGNAMFGMDMEALAADPTGLSFFATSAAIPMLIWCLIVIVPSIAVTVRRFHDRNMSGWWYLGFAVASLIPYVGWIASIALLVLMLLPGTPGPNRFGPDPKDPGQAEVFA